MAHIPIPKPRKAPKAKNMPRGKARKKKRKMPRPVAGRKR